MGLGPEARDRTRKGGAGPELALSWMSLIAADREVVGLGWGLELAVPSPRGEGGTQRPQLSQRPSIALGLNASLLMPLT